MKTKLSVVIGCLGMMMWGIAFSYGNYKGEIPTRIWQQTTYVAPQKTCRTCTTVAVNDGCGSSCSSAFMPPCYSCSCTDPNCASNPCMSSCRYCALFGNVGDADMGEPLL